MGATVYYMEMQIISKKLKSGVTFTLFALRSPKKRNEKGYIGSSDWVMETVFYPSGETGKVTTIEVPWTALPLLACGQQFLDDVLLDSRDGQEVWLNLDNHPTLERIGQVLPIPRATNPWSEDNEWAFVWRTNQTKLVLPVLEVLRACVAPNQDFVRGLLDPNFLFSIGHYRVANDALHLEFNHTVRLPNQRKRREQFIREIARLLLDPTFGSAFRSVALNRISQNTHAIKTTFPELLGKVQCLVKEVAGVYLIQQLIHFQPAQPLPIKSIFFKHPNFTKRYRVRIQKSEAQAVAGGALQHHLEGGRIKKNRSRVIVMANPQPNNQPNIPVYNEGLFDLDQIKEVLLPNKNSQQQLFVMGAGENDQEFPLGKIERDFLHDDASSDTPKDFRQNESWMKNVKRGLRHLIELVNRAKTEYPALEVDFREGVRQIPNTEKIIKRDFVIIEFSEPIFGKCWIIEFQQPTEIQIEKSKKYSAATLRLKFRDSKKTWADVEPVIVKLLLDYLTETYHWKKGEFNSLETEFNIEIQRIKHHEKRVVSWAKRILEG
jgi:hypothetical protein